MLEPDAQLRLVVEILTILALVVGTLGLLSLIALVHLIVGEERKPRRRPARSTRPIGYRPRAMPNVFAFHRRRAIASRFR